ncbi:hypothetical protein ARMSODRAFT_981801 [Armillaria solidipes]|uniref:Uncharacterized protein n=1 Tax=Armillaria solidipes TaxID=1076256 RepID=A0A2H3AQI4_9AGAR|nr:hypothetical protein ARMSODRAFT_981801 [Armillaria solidipes]
MTGPPSPTRPTIWTLHPTCHRRHDESSALLIYWYKVVPAMLSNPIFVLPIYVPWNVHGTINKSLVKIHKCSRHFPISEKTLSGIAAHSVPGSSGELRTCRTPIFFQLFFESGSSDSCMLMGFLAVVHSTAAAAGSSITVPYQVYSRAKECSSFPLLHRELEEDKGWSVRIG